MKKAILAITAAAIIAAGTLAAPQQAEARGGRNAAIIGGVAAAAIIGGAIAANSGPSYYGPAPGYVAYDGYYGRRPHGCGGGYWARRPVYDRWGNQRGWSRPRFICP
ncbi:MAG: hypothetical protein Q7T81_00305 [Pseudolabrys sp.]|nr:hypothetical protein [Pseudolabrys sp.]